MKKLVRDINKEIYGIFSILIFVIILGVIRNLPNQLESVIILIDLVIVVMLGIGIPFGIISVMKFFGRNFNQVNNFY